MNTNSKSVWIVLVCSVIVLCGLYWYLGGGSASSPISNTISINPNNPSTTSTSIDNNNKITMATFHTSKGDITVEFSKDTPMTVGNFIKLAQSGFYNETKFHRVIKGFMNQGGDPLSKDDSMMARWGTGGPGYQFADELGANNHNNQFTLAMANAGPNTNGSQFFFNAANNNFLDDKHTVFAKVVSGMDVVTAINDVPTGASDRPVTPVVINSISLQ
jgi:cyclophilin family peptidyl-prolyl cis-trans isomerase